MQRIIIALLLFMESTSAFSQNSAGKYAAMITPADLKKQLTIVAGPGMEGRETSTNGQKKAAAYIENYFKKLGLKPGNNGSYQQVFSLYKDSMLNSRLAIGQDEFRYGADYMISVRFNKTKNVNAKAIVFAGYGISDSLYNDYNDLDVKDAIVVLALGEPKSGDKYLVTGTSQPSAWASIAKKDRQPWNEALWESLSFPPGSRRLIHLLR